MTAVFRGLWYLLPANPMVVRAVQGGSRRLGHLWVRMGYLGGLILAVVFVLLRGQGLGTQVDLTDLAKAGTQIFVIISYAQVILVCLLSPLFMAGAIARERTGQTYDILLTTPMSSLQIVLGSLMGRLFFVWALLASGLPLFSVLLIFGGVPIEAVFVSFTVAALSALAVGAVASSLSVLFRVGGRKVVFGFIIVVAAYLVITYCLDLFLLRRLAGVRIGGADGTTWLTPLHPLLVLEASINSATYRLPTADILGGYPWAFRFYLSRPFATFSLLTAVTSGALLAASSWSLRRAMRCDGDGLMLWLRRKFRLADPAQGIERRRPPRAVWANPIAWREASTRGNRAASILGRWGFAFAGASAVLTLIFFYHQGRLPSIPDATGKGVLPQHEVFRLGLLTLLLAEVSVIGLIAIYMSASCVSREREDGTLDLVLTTPITPRLYIWGKLRGLVSFLMLLLAVPIASVLAVSFYTVVGQLRNWPHAQVPHESITSTGTTIRLQVPLILPEAALLLATMLVPFIALCVAVGMHQSVKAKGVLTSVASVVAVIGALILVTGLCGFNAAANLPIVGPLINAFSPVTNLLMLLDPWSHVADYPANPLLGRLSLALAAAAAAAGYSFVAYSVLGSLVKGFDQTVRKLTATA